MFGYDTAQVARGRIKDRLREAEQERLAREIRQAAGPGHRLAIPTQLALALAQIGHLVALATHRPECPEADAS